MFKARFLQPKYTTTPKSKLFTRRLAARRAESSADDKATLPVMVVSPELFAQLTPAIADLTTADAEPVTEAASVPATKTQKRGRTRKKESSGDTARKKSS